MSRALCYDSASNRLYNGIAGTSDCIFSEHDEKGYKTIRIGIPNEPVEIVISSNLHFQGASYLYAKIFIQGKSLLNFRDTQSLYLLNDCEFDSFQVPAGNWGELFDLIVDAYNNWYSISDNDIEKYFCELDTMIQSNCISILRNKTDVKPHVWNGSFLVLLHSLDIITNIIKCREKSVLEANQFLTKRILSTCNTFVKRFANNYRTWDIEEGDSRIKRFSEELVVIHNFFNQFGKPIEFVDILVACNK